MKLIRWLLLLLAVTPVCAQQNLGPANLAGLLYASNFAQWSVPQGNQGQYSWASGSACTVTSGGLTFNAFTVGVPIQIFDTGNPANSEVVTPTLVTINSAGCSLGINPTREHTSFVLKSSTAGLGEAIGYAGKQNYEIILTPIWTQLGGVTGTITSSIGNSNVTILDQRTSIIVPYTWGGSAYVADPFGVGSNSVQLNPTGSQTIAQPSGTSFNSTSINQVLNAFAFPNGCVTTSMGNTSWQGDCAFGKAKDLAIATFNSVDLVVGDGYLTACQEWTEPTNGFYGVNLIGTSMNGSVIIKECSTPSSPMLAKTGGYAYMKMANLTFNPNGNADSCFDIAYLYGYDIDNVTCDAPLSGSDHALQLGTNAAFDMNGSINNLIASPSYGIPQTYAAITGTLTGTSLTSLSCGGSCGAYSYPAIVVGIVNDPHHYCSVLPAFTPVMTGTAISSFTINIAGTCSSAPDFSAIQQDNVAVGMRLYISDSSVINTQQNEGVIGAELYGGNDDIVHSHPTAVKTGWLIDNIGNANFVGLECDTLASLCLDFASTNRIIVAGSLPYTTSANLAGFSMFKFESGSDNAGFEGVGDLCPDGCPTDFQEFIGTAGILTPGGSGWPSGGSVSGNDYVNGTGGDYSPQFNAATVQTKYVLPSLLYSAAGTPLPTCVTGLKGALATVSDATTPSYNGTYTSGGAVVAPVVCNGSAWLTH